VYVEPGLSLNQQQVTGTHFLASQILAPPRLKHYKLPSKGDKEVAAAIKALLEVNSPANVAQLLGWFSACHLRSHFMRQYTQFPVLSIWGAAEAGKTVTATLFAWLNGCDYSMQDSPMSVASITPFAMIGYCASSTTIPRLLDEYNKSKIAKKMYDHCGEVMKASWNKMAMGRGTLGASVGGQVGAHVAQLPISAPLVIMSEQAPEMTALQHRSIQIMLTKKSRQGREDAFEDANESREQLARIGKALVTHALMTDNAWIVARMKTYRSVVPRSLGDRSCYSYKLLLVGLDFFEACCARLELGLEEELAAIKQALLDTLKEEAEGIAQAKGRSEVDQVIEEMVTMIALSDDGSDAIVTRGRHFMTTEASLLLDIPMIHALYKKYARVNRSRVVIESAGQFMQLLAQEPYYRGLRSEPDMVKGRDVVELNLASMAEKGHMVSLLLR
jgi:hypothetical protein